MAAEFNAGKVAKMHVDNQTPGFGPRHVRNELFSRRINFGRGNLWKPRGRQLPLAPWISSSMTATTE